MLFRRMIFFFLAVLSLEAIHQSSGSSFRDFFVKNNNPFGTTPYCNNSTSLVEGAQNATVCGVCYHNDLVLVWWREPKMPTVCGVCYDNDLVLVWRRPDRTEMLWLRVEACTDHTVKTILVRRSLERARNTIVLCAGGYCGIALASGGDPNTQKC